VLLTGPGRPASPAPGVPRLDRPERLAEHHAEGGAADDVEGQVGAGVDPGDGDEAGQPERGPRL